MLNITFSLRKENLLLSTAQRAEGVNYTSLQLNDETKEMVENSNIDDHVDGQVIMNKLNAIKNSETLDTLAINEIKSKANVERYRYLTYF